MKRPSSLEGLTNQQRAAARAGPEGPILVSAGPGSGKTKVLIARIVWLVKEHGIPPGSILAMTFSVKAAKEMRLRILQENLGKDIWIGTFHRLCRETLNAMYPQDLFPWKPGIEFIKSDRKRLDVVEAAMRELEPERNQFPAFGEEILRGISFAKNWLVPPHKYRKRPASSWDVDPGLEERVAAVYLHYQRRMQSINAMDFDDQLMQTAILLHRKPALLENIGRRFQFVLVDEFQDLNHAQYRLTQLFGRRGNIFVVGDDDQTIYSWRGADSRNFENIRRDYAGLRQFFLRQNFRSKSRILEPSQNLVKNNQGRTEKGLFTCEGEGEPIHIEATRNEMEEAKYIANKIVELGKRIVEQDKRLEEPHFAVLYRNKFQSQEIQQALCNAEIPFSMADDVPLYSFVEIRDMLAFLRLCTRPDDNISFQRVINVPRRWIGPVGLGKFFDWIQDEGMKIDEGLKELLDGVRPDSLAEDRRWIEGFREFAKLLFRDWILPAKHNQLTRLFDGIREQIAYDEYIDRYSGSTEIGESPRARERKRNLNLFRETLELAENRGKTLREFLKESELAQALQQKDHDAVSLMTLHKAKGLEFPVVFISGMEEGLLPDRRSAEVSEKLEEERRLFYVGVTRAKNELQLTWAATRTNRSGEPIAREASRFLKELETGESPPPREVLIRK
ncbi:MAG: UvrD-helicase domain-containing protein [Anaerolineaceae bacterium]|nr:UvrD-helicase domain-containing protein [Anaerolineaceae bacterium]